AYAAGERVGGDEVKKGRIALTAIFDAARANRRLGALGRYCSRDRRGGPRRRGPQAVPAGTLR
ncbi:MAG: hypothetical protein ACPL7K_07565, partial [Armatimonadota bacterium]